MNFTEKNWVILRGSQFQINIPEKNWVILRGFQSQMNFTEKNWENHTRDSVFLKIYPKRLNNQLLNPV